MLCFLPRWLDSNISDQEISIQGYSAFRLDRSRHGSGILLYVKSVFTTPVLVSGATDFELLLFLLSVTLFLLLNQSLLLHCSIDHQTPLFPYWIPYLILFV